MARRHGKIDWHKLFTSKIVWVNLISALIGAAGLLLSSGLVTNDTTLRVIGFLGDIATLVLRIFFLTDPIYKPPVAADSGTSTSAGT